MKLNVKLIIFMWFEFHFGLPIIHLLSMHAWWAIAMYWIQATVTNTHWQHWFNAIQNHFSVKPTMPNNFIRLSGNVKSFHFVAEKSVCLLQCECDFFYVQQFFCIQRIFFLWTSVFVVIQLSAFDTMKITNATEKCVLLGQYRTEGNVGSFYTFSYVLIAFETSERHLCSDFVNKTKQNKTIPNKDYHCVINFCANGNIAQNANIVCCLRSIFDDKRYSTNIYLNLDEVRWCVEQHMQTLSVDSANYVWF